MINRWVERDGLKDTLKELGIGSIAFTPLAQGMLTNKYLKGVPKGSRLWLKWRWLGYYGMAGLQRL